MIPRTTSPTRWANSSASCSNPPGNILEEVEEIASLTPETSPDVRPVSPSPTPVPMSVAMTPTIPPDVVVVVVVPEPVVPVLPVLVVLPLVVPPKRSVTRPPKMSVTTVPKNLPILEKTLLIPDDDDVVLAAGVVVLVVDALDDAGVTAVVGAGVPVVAAWVVAGVVAMSLIFSSHYMQECQKRVWWSQQLQQCSLSSRKLLEKLLLP